MSKTVKLSDPLIDQFFHSFDDKYEIQTQGQVIALIKPGFYLCQMYDWLMGMASSQEVISVEQMVTGKFQFYYDEAYWKMRGTQLARKIQCDPEPKSSN